MNKQTQSFCQRNICAVSLCNEVRIHFIFTIQLAQSLKNGFASNCTFNKSGRAGVHAFAQSFRAAAAAAAFGLVDLHFSIHCTLLLPLPSADTHFLCWSATIEFFRERAVVNANELLKLYLSPELSFLMTSFLFLLCRINSKRFPIYSRDVWRNIKSVSINVATFCIRMQPQAHHQPAFRRPLFLLHLQRLHHHQ